MKYIITDVGQIERKLDDTIGCVYPPSVEKLCTMAIYELSHVLKHAQPSDVKALIRNYQFASHRDEMTYKKW